MDRERKSPNPNRRFTLYLINIIVLSAITIFALASAAITSARLAQTIGLIEDGQENSTARLQRLRTETAQEEREKMLGEIRDSLESGESTSAMLRSLFAEDIVAMSGGRFFFTPLDTSLPAKSVGAGDLEIGSDDTVRYTGKDSHVRIQRGIDVSSDNGDIDWSRAAESQVAFAMIRLGYVDETGEFREDRRFARNLAGALQNGIRVGCFMEIPGNGWTEDAAATEDLSQKCVECAENMVRILEPYSSRISLPASILVVTQEGREEEAQQMRGERTEAIAAACGVIADAGFTPMVGGDIAALSLSLDMSGLTDEAKWYTGADASLYFPYEWSMWQYRSGGRIEGISGDVKLDIHLTVRD